MKIINTAEIVPKNLKQHERDWVYNGLDCCVTYEILDVLLEQLNKYTTNTYNFSLALQAPVLDMRMRGVKVDEARRAKAIDELDSTIENLETNLERIVREGYDYVGFNWRSTFCLRHLFHNICQIPPDYNKEGNITVNRNAVEKLANRGITREVVKHILELRDVKKQLDAVKTPIDPDGRIRTAYNIAGTDTGRFSSSFSEFQTGGNLQNVEESIRSMFIADDGYKMANFDAAQGESRVVGAIEWNLFRLGQYLDACESGDLHTVVSRLCEPKYGWTGNLDLDREIAEKPYYRHHSLRKLCKSIGHGTNYLGGPETLNSQYHVPIELIADFQPKYFKAFPGHKMWHAWVEEQLRANGKLLSLSGRLRHFMGRRDDNKILRKAVAYDPQCSLSDIVKRGMIKVHGAYICELLLETHDSITVQYPQEIEDEIIPKIKNLLEVQLPLQHGRTLTIPYGCQTGWNWGKFNDDPEKGPVNPNGLKEYEPGDQRTREAEVDILDIKLR